MASPSPHTWFSVNVTTRTRLIAAPAAAIVTACPLRFEITDNARVNAN